MDGCSCSELWKLAFFMWISCFSSLLSEDLFFGLFLNVINDDLMLDTFSLEAVTKVGLSSFFSMDCHSCEFPILSCCCHSKTVLAFSVQTVIHAVQLSLEVTYISVLLFFCKAVCVCLLVILPRVLGGGGGVYNCKVKCS